MYMSQEMPNLRRFLARFWLSDNQMTIILSALMDNYLLVQLHLAMLCLGSSSKEYVRIRL